MPGRALERALAPPGERADREPGLAVAADLVAQVVHRPTCTGQDRAQRCLAPVDEPPWRPTSPWVDQPSPSPSLSDSQEPAGPGRRRELAQHRGQVGAGHVQQGGAGPDAVVGSAAGRRSAGRARPRRDRRPAAARRSRRDVGAAHRQPGGLELQGVAAPALPISSTRARRRARRRTSARRAGVVEVARGVAVGGGVEVVGRHGGPGSASRTSAGGGRRRAGGSARACRR